MQLPLIVPETTWKPKAEFFPIHYAKRICIDIETKDPDLKELGPGVRRRGSYIVGIAIAIENGPSAYYPIRHENGENLCENTVTDWCFREFSRYPGEVVGANILYDLDFLASEGIHFLDSSCTFLDVQHAEALINENQRRYNLNSLCEKYLGEPKREDLLNEAAYAYGVDPKKELWRIPSEYVGPYAIGDVELPLKILRKQEKEIEKQDLHQIWKLETDLLPAMLDMRRLGIRIDQDQLERCEVYFKEQEDKELSKIVSETGHDLREDIWNGEKVAAMFRSIGIVPNKTEKTEKDSITSGWLEQISTKHPIALSFLNVRRYNKVRTTFCDGIRRHITNGRIHPNFNQLRGDKGGTVSGRLSCNHPNIQQMPIRNKDTGRMFRSIFLPEEDHQYGRFDYKEQEPKLVLHYALTSFKKNKDVQNLLKIHGDNPNLDSYKLISNTLEREICKTVYLALLYGAGGLKICETLNLPTEVDITGRKLPGKEAKAIIRNFNSGAPYIKKLVKKCTDRALARGYIKTFLGRHCRFTDPQFTYKATNRLIQGSAADQMKQAIINMHREGIIPHMQVHDEVGVSVHGTEEAVKIKEIMENAIDLKIPAIVDYQLGKSWGSCKE